MKTSRDMQMFVVVTHLVEVLSFETTDVKDGKVSNLFSGYTETNNTCIHSRIIVNFFPENINKK
jgi:hypothetical protein